MTGESSDAVESETILAYVRERMDAAEILWESAEYERVAELLDQILLVDPEHERALELSEDIRRRQVRRPQRDRTTVVQESTSADEPTVAVPVQPQRSQVTRKGKLEISFLTHVAEGQVTVHCNRNPIFQETFDFPDIRPFRRQLLKNPERLGTILILPARIVELKVELQLPKTKGDLKTQVRNLSGNLSPQVDRVLQITVTEEYALSVELL